MVPGEGVRPVCVVCGKEIMAEVWRTEKMCDVRTESGVDGCRRHKPCSTSVELRGASSCVKWMVVCGVRAVWMGRMVSPVRERER